MIYGVEQSTDLRDRRTVIKKFSSIVAARKWAQNSGGFTHGNPQEARNHHHTFRYLYEHRGRVDKTHSAFKEAGTSTYPMNDADRMANYLCIMGYEIKQGN